MALPLPPQVSAADFKQALEQFAQAVGSQWVFTSEEDVMLYRDAYSPLWDDPDELIPSAAVAPSTVEEVQAVVRIANRFKIPLFAISTGMNLGYGGSSPNLRDPFQQLRLFGGMSLLHDKFGHYPDAALSPPNPPPLGGNQSVVGDATGNRLPFTSTFSGNIGAAYEIPVGDSKITLNGNLTIIPVSMRKRTICAVSPPMSWSVVRSSGRMRRVS